jgi:PAS domain S-box-containing protein
MTKIKILIVDNEPQQRHLLCALLSADGYVLDQAANGAEALEVARGAPPDLIVSEILMPVMDGFALCRAWKEDARLKHIPFVFYIAAHVEAGDEACARSLGADQFITEPVAPDRLLALLQETLAAGSRAPQKVGVAKETSDQEYGATLVRDLEAQMQQLAATNRALEHDIAERIQAETRLRTLNRMYGVLSNVNQAIVRIRELQALFDLVCRIAVQIGGFRLAWIGILDAAGQLQVTARAGGSDAYYEQAVITVRGAPAAFCPVQSALRSRQRVVCAAPEMAAPCQQIAAPLGVNAAAAFPLQVAGQMRGVVTFCADDPDFFNEEEIQLLDELVLDVSFALEFAEKEAERSRAEEALRTSEKRLRSLYESGLLGVTYWNTDGAIFEANDKFLTMTGYSRAELEAGQLNWITLTPAEYRYLDARSAAELEATGINSAPYEKEYIRRDGTRIPVILAAAMLDEERHNGVAFVLDNTERKRAEAQLIEQLDELRRWYSATLGRETRILKLKREVNELLAQTGQPPRYASAESESL